MTGANADCDMPGLGNMVMGQDYKGLVSVALQDKCQSYTDNFVWTMYLEICSNIHGLTFSSARTDI